MSHENSTAPAARNSAAVIHGERVDIIGGRGALLVDLRDPRELEASGRIPGAKSCPRGMLEFWIDPESPYHKPYFSSGKPIVFYCASGWRSALAARTAGEMGLESLHLGGGLKAWREAGLPFEPGGPRP